MLLDPEVVSTAKESAENWLRLVKPRQLYSICSSFTEKMLTDLSESTVLQTRLP